MTLAKQLNLVISLVFVLVFAGTCYLTLDNTRMYVAAQLESHAQDTATSLGLSLSTAMASGDVLMMESMVDAIFDRGYYRSIVVRDAAGSELVVRVLRVRVSGVPDWFVRALPLVTPLGSARVMAGWRQGGEVQVYSHPGYAYQKLWANAVDTLWWSLGSLILAITATSLTLRLLLGPLRAVEAQALAIAQSEFPRLDPVPRTRELRRVVLAMNQMVAKTEEMLKGLTRRVKKLRDQAYTDPLTGLGNRQTFDRGLTELTGRREEHVFGACLRVTLAGLEDVNAAHGHEGGDALIRKAARQIEDAVPSAQCTLARLGGGMFALVAPDATLDEAASLADALVACLTPVSIEGVVPAGASVGVAYFDGAQSAARLVENAEAALAEAQAAGVNCWRLFDAGTVHGVRDAQDALRWERLLQQVIAERGIELHYQPVRSANLRDLLHYEALARVRTAEGEMVPANTFLAIAKRAGIAPALDRVVVEKVIERLQASDAANVRVAINLAPASISSSEFVDWLKTTLEARPVQARALIFEVSEYCAVSALERVQALAALLKNAGACLGLDHFGIADPMLDFVAALRMEYVKIDGGFISGIDGSEDARAVVGGFVEVLRGLDVRIIAERVETSAEHEALVALGVNGIQGYLTGKPQASMAVHD